MSSAGRRRGPLALALGGAAALVAAPAGWLVTDHLERDDDFCNACHLEPEIPLHRDVRTSFDARPAATLGGVHGAGRVEDAAPRAFRCIDCHGGASLLGRARVKALAAMDAFWYVAGRFEEPDGMRWPLWDEDCAQCHARFDTSEPEEWEETRFHQLPLHNVELGVGCVECHVVHDAGGDADAHFLHASRVRAQCARCHAGFEEG